MKNDGVLVVLLLFVGVVAFVGPAKLAALLSGIFPPQAVRSSSALAKAQNDTWAAAPLAVESSFFSAPEFNGDTFQFSQAAGLPVLDLSGVTNG